MNDGYPIKNKACRGYCCANPIEAIAVGILQSMIGSLKTNIFSKTDSFSDNHRAEILSLKDELKGTIE